MVLREHVDGFHIDAEIRKFYPEARIVVIPEVPGGAVLTCLEGIRGMADDEPVLFNDCDHMFLSRNFNNFCATGDFSGIDGALLTFESDEPRYSFLEYDASGRVICTAEKEVVSRHAVCGVYYFKNCRTFREAAGNTLRDADVHIPFGTPEEYYAAEGDGGLRLVEGA